MDIEDDLQFNGISVLKDSLQEKAPEVVRFLTANASQFWMLTGDQVETAKATGKAIGIISE